MNSKDLIKILKRDGWFEVRQAGSHKIFKHEHKKITISVPYHGAKDIPVGTLKAILKLMR